MIKDASWMYGADFRGIVLQCLCLPISRPELLTLTSWVPFGSGGFMERIKTVFQRKRSLKVRRKSKNKEIDAWLNGLTEIPAECARNKFIPLLISEAERWLLQKTSKYFSEESWATRNIRSRLAFRGDRPRVYRRVRASEFRIGNDSFVVHAFVPVYLDVKGNPCSGFYTIDDGRVFGHFPRIATVFDFPDRMLQVFDNIPDSKSRKRICSMVGPCAFEDSFASTDLVPPFHREGIWWNAGFDAGEFDAQVMSTTVAGPEEPETISIKAISFVHSSIKKIHVPNRQFGSDRCLIERVPCFNPVLSDYKHEFFPSCLINDLITIVLDYLSAKYKRCTGNITYTISKRKSPGV
jgi:hypothetical protein